MLDRFRNVAGLQEQIEPVTQPQAQPQQPEAQEPETQTGQEGMAPETAEPEPAATDTGAG